MKKIILLSTALIFFLVHANAQISGTDSLVKEGVALHDKGDFAAAIEKFKSALLLEPSSSLGNYEMANTYFSLKDYEKAMEYCDKVIDARNKYLAEAYMLKGNVLDITGKPDKAIKTYKTAIKNFPEQHLLYYNLALTQFNQKDYPDAVESLEGAFAANPSHASSHLLMAGIMGYKKSRVKTLLSLYNFLLLEPTGSRAQSAWLLMDDLLQKNVKKEGENKITIMFDPKAESDEFSTAELTLSLLESSKSLEKNKNKSEQELFIENTSSFFTILGELKGKKKGFWFNFYVDFFYEMVSKKHVETFCYYILQTKEPELANDWLKKNKDKVEALSKWYNGFKRVF